jgi:NAD(P)-dependent dehydrogenase (short-subunit alcohol dehydrogenase family)
MTERSIAIVTGAGTGIGKHSAIALLDSGYAVVFAGRRKEVLDEAIEEADAGDRAVAVATDVGDPAAVAALFAKTTKRFGRVDLLFNNAGTSAPVVPLEEVSPEQWQRVVAANLNGTFFCTQEAFRIMKSQQPMGGRIINNGSISAHVPRPWSAPYTATKHAITGLTKSTALDGRRYNIACGQIDIGNALTSMTARMSQGVKQPGGDVLTEPMMDVADVARAVVYMASLPLSANVLSMTVMATAMPFVGRG